MIIALDYDYTFTKDPEAWFAAMHYMALVGHTIIGVTLRYPSEASDMDKRYDDLCDHIYFTSRVAKQSAMAVHGIHVDVWIDDSPKWILNNALT